MQLTYKYRLKPTKAQLVTIAAHLEPVVGSTTTGTVKDLDGGQPREYL